MLPGWLEGKNIPNIGATSISRAGRAARLVVDLNTRPVVPLCLDHHLSLCAACYLLPASGASSSASACRPSSQFSCASSSAAPAPSSPAHFPQLVFKLNLINGAMPLCAPPRGPSGNSIFAFVIGAPVAVVLMSYMSNEGCPSPCVLFDGEHT